MGEKEFRKMRPLYVAKYIARHADTYYCVSANDIANHLYEEYGMSVDRKTIYRDIAMLRDQFGMDIQMSPGREGYNLVSRQFELDDITILAECVYAARFISEERTNDLVDVLCQLCSEHQEEILKKDLYSTERIKTQQNSTLRTINQIRAAIHPKEWNRQIRRNIKFRYLTHTIDNVHLLVEKHGGKIYTVTPCEMVINEGNYYLLAYNHELREMRTYRIDRMTDVEIIDGYPHGWREYRKQKTRDYLQRSFSMFGGECTKVKLLFDNSLLDTVVDKFGTTAMYEKVDDEHFTVKTRVYISDQFFGWLCGFGTKVKLIYPEDMPEKFKKYLDEIINIY